MARTRSSSSDSARQSDWASQLRGGGGGGRRDSEAPPPPPPPPAKLVSGSSPRNGAESSGFWRDAAAAADASRQPTKKQGKAKSASSSMAKSLGEPRAAKAASAAGKNKSKLLGDMEASIQKLLSATHSNLDSLQAQEGIDAPDNWSSQDLQGPDSNTYPWLAEAARVSVDGQITASSKSNLDFGLDSLSIRRKARISDLRDRDKAKIAKIVQQVLTLTQENETLRSTAESEAARFAQETTSLREEVAMWKAKYEACRTKFGQSLTMLKTYQDKIIEMQRDAESAETDETKGLKEQVAKLTALMLEHQAARAQGAECAVPLGKVDHEQINVSEEIPRVAAQSDAASRKQSLVAKLEAAESELEKERARVASALEESERARERFDGKLSEHFAIRTELEKAMDADQSKCTGSLPQVREKLQTLLAQDESHKTQPSPKKMSEAFLALSSKLCNERQVSQLHKAAEDQRQHEDEEKAAQDAVDPRVTAHEEPREIQSVAVPASLEEGEDDIFEDFLRHQRKTKSERTKAAQRATRGPGAGTCASPVPDEYDDDFEYGYDDFDALNGNEHTTDRLGAGDSSAAARFASSISDELASPDDDNDDAGHGDRDVDKSSAWSEADSELFKSGPHGVIDHANFENSHFEASLFNVIDEIENRS